jgi:hypothetical protein
MQIENISDEDMMNMEAPPTFVTNPEPVEQQEEPVVEPEPAAVVEEQQLEGDDNEDEDEDEVKEAEGNADLSDTDLDNQEVPVLVPEKKEVEPASVVEPKAEKKEAPKPADKADEKASEIDFAVEYAKLVGTPIKANGKEITLKNTDEVLRLVQQGANYAKRMEDLKPARKSAAMLEKANLLGDEIALSHMIDLYNGKPEALVKLVKDLKIDIYSLDLEGESKYTPTSHLQTDEAVTFDETLKEVRTLEGGNEAMKLIDSWDQSSKNMIWGNATAIRQIYDYKQSGVYDTVATEVERRRTLGQIPADTPFIVAFQAVGEEIAKAAEASAPIPAPTQQNNLRPEPAKPATRTPVASGVAPRKVETPDARAVAAASPRGGVGQAKQSIDIYQYSDADIEKMSGPPV